MLRKQAGKGTPRGSVENHADVDVVFRKDTEGLWEEMLQQTRKIRAGGELPYAAAFTRAFSNVILDPR